MQLIYEPGLRRCFAGNHALFHDSFQAFGIRKPAHRQRRRGEPDQLQQVSRSQNAGQSVVVAVIAVRAVYVRFGRGHNGDRN
jgi:hypothetical protein